MTSDPTSGTEMNSTPKVPDAAEVGRPLEFPRIPEELIRGLSQADWQRAVDALDRIFFDNWWLGGANRFFQNRLIEEASYRDIPPLITAAVVERAIELGIIDAGPTLINLKIHITFAGEQTDRGRLDRQLETSSERWREGFHRLRNLRGPTEPPTGVPAPATAMVIHSATIQVAAAQIETAVARPPDKVPTEAALRVDSWKELGIAIDHNWDYWAFIPAPKIGQRVSREDGHRLHLPGERWKAVLDLLSRSEDGRSISAIDLLRTLDQLPPPADTPSDGPVLRRSREAAIKAELTSRKSAVKPGKIMNDLARNLRKQVAGPIGRGTSAFETSGLTVRAQFLTQCLMSDASGSLTFGKITQGK